MDDRRKIKIFHNGSPHNLYVSGNKIKIETLEKNFGCGNLTYAQSCDHSDKQLCDCETFISTSEFGYVRLEEKVVEYRYKNIEGEPLHFHLIARIILILT